MSMQIIKVSRPTRIELLRLRRRLRLARRFYNLLKDREAYLLEVFRNLLREVVKTRRELNELLIKAYSSYYTSLYLEGLEGLNVYASTIPQTLNLYVSYKNIMGVWTYTYGFEGIPPPQPQLPLELSDLQVSREKILELLAKVFEYEKTLVNVGAEIARLRRIVNILEKSYIPRLTNTIRYLSMKFEELQREETIRAIRVKKKLVEGRVF
ncbi:MAG: V-type ATP synthase subunit D [Desulfurococcaceae archaeon]|nr:V-type ATP synthase subunit D [Desulfurococcaceae archaeon]